MRNLLADPAAPWWDNATTPEKETREGLMAQAFARTVADLKSRLGADVGAWQWGKLHQAIFANQTLGRSGISLIEGIFNRGPFPAEGGSALVNATGHTEALTVRAVPSMRMIVDMADLTRSLAIHTTGQSGHAYNAHYDDMIVKWLNGQQNPMLWSRANVQKNAEATLVLTP
jgi:penicillin amidase